MLEFFIFSTLVSIYFIPSIIATIKNHHDLPQIIPINIFFGWCIAGYIITLCWALDYNPFRRKD